MSLASFQAFERVVETLVDRTAVAFMVVLGFVGVSAIAMLGA